LADGTGHGMMDGRGNMRPRPVEQEAKDMDMQDRRVKRTQQLLAKALIVLTLEKGYEAVTIRDITDYADVGYATFFRHYHDKDALLRDVSEVVLADLKGLLPTSAGADAVEIGTTLFRYVQENSNIIRVLLSSRGTSSLVQHIIDISIQDVLNKNTSLEGSAIPIEIAAYHLVNSSIAMIQWWLEHDLPYPPEHMGIVFHQLIIQPTRHVSFSPISHEG
jgi:AcrR family transcriptional regulator